MTSDPPSQDLLHDTASAFGMLAATVRLHIMWLLADGERDVGALAEELGQSVATVSHHLGKLKAAGWVRVRRQGRHRVYLADDDGVIDIVRRAVAHQQALRHAPAGRRSRGA